MQNYDRLSIVVSLVLLGLALTVFINLPTRLVQMELFGSPVTVALSSRFVMALLLSTLTAVGVEYIMRAHPQFSTEQGAGYSFPFWILPTFITLAAAWLTPRLLPGGLLPWLAGLLATATLLSGTIVAEYRTITTRDPFYTPARLFLNVATYAGGLVLFGLIYGAKLRSALSASMVTMLAALLALSLLRVEKRMARSWVYSVICGLLLGEATWALNYWGVGGLAGGSLLVLVFYFFTGLAQQRLLGRFGQPVLVEFTVIGAVGLLLLASQGALTW